MRKQRYFDGLSSRCLRFLFRCPAVIERSYAETALKDFVKDEGIIVPARLGDISDGSICTGKEICSFLHPEPQQILLRRDMINFLKTARQITPVQTDLGCDLTDPDLVLVMTGNIAQSHLGVDRLGVRPGSGILFIIALKIKD